MLLLHTATSSPEVIRRGLQLLRAAERRNEVEPVDVAMLEDKILTLEGKPQLYGTQLEWDTNGELTSLPIADPQDAPTGVSPTTNIRRSPTQTHSGSPSVSKLSVERRAHFGVPFRLLRRRGIDRWYRVSRRDTTSNPPCPHSILLPALRIDR